MQQSDLLPYKESFSPGDVSFCVQKKTNLQKEYPECPQKQWNEERLQDLLREQCAMSRIRMNIPCRTFVLLSVQGHSQIFDHSVNACFALQSTPCIKDNPAVDISGETQIIC